MIWLHPVLLYFPTIKKSTNASFNVEQAQRDMERDQLEKQMETTREYLSDSGWNILEEEGNKTAHDDDTAQKTRTQMLREEAIRWAMD